MAADAKERGNAFFKAGDYRNALTAYSEAIAADPTDAIFWSNRSGAYLALYEYDHARADAVKACELNPTWWKAWSRRGKAESELKRWPDAEQAYAKAVEFFVSLHGDGATQAAGYGELKEGLDKARSMLAAEREQQRRLEQMSTADLEKAHVEGLRQLSIAQLRREAEEARVAVREGATHEELVAALSAQSRGVVGVKPSRPWGAGCCGSRAAEDDGMTAGQRALAERKKRVAKLNALSEKQLVRKLVKAKVDTSQCRCREDLVSLVLRVETEQGERGISSRPQWLGIACFAFCALVTFAAAVIGVWILAGSDSGEEAPERTSLDGMRL